MPTIKELHELYLSKLTTTLRESALLLQKQEGGLDGELKTSGWICEQFIRQTLQRFIVPGHFRITSGFIATPELMRGGDNLPQCDILIVSGNAPPLLRFEETGIEVVPYESIAGIIEVKRTLTKQNIESSSKGVFSHLASVINSLGQNRTLKTDKTLNMFNIAAGVGHNYSSDKPLIGVIALQNGIDHMPEVVRSAINASDSLVDFIWTVDGHALLPGSHSLGQDNFHYYSHTARPETRTWEKLTSDDFESTGSPFYRLFSGSPRWYYLGRPASQASNKDLFDPAQVFARIIGVVSLMLSRICTRPLREEHINDYFLRPV
jgi:hypothetical protein